VRLELRERGDDARIALRRLAVELQVGRDHACVFRASYVRGVGFYVNTENSITCRDDVREETVDQRLRSVVSMVFANERQARGTTRSRGAARRFFAKKRRREKEREAQP
jgi:hypothetical protein